MNNPPAFPRSGYIDTTSGTLPDGDAVIRHENGMTLRDYFAAKAMQALVGCHLWAEAINKKADITAYEEITSRQSYVIADAMLKAREQ